MRVTKGVISIALMALCLWCLVFLMVFGLVQQSRADIKELKSVNSGPLYELSVNSRYTATGDQILLSKLQHQVEERQSSQNLPQVYGEYMFEDGYGQGRIHYSGKDSDVIFVLTYDLRNSIPYRSNLYRSTNYGASFTNISNLVDDSVLYHTFSSSHFNRDLLLLVHATEARLYYTLDEGVTFIRRDLSPDTLNPRSIEHHPTHDDWMMTVDSDNSLYVTVDYAATWKQVAFNVAIFHWADEKWDDNTEMLYFMTRDPEKADLTVNLFTSAYPFTDVAEFDSNLGGLDVFLLVGPYIYAQRTDDDVISLYVSYKRQPFQKTVIPTPYAQKSYLVTHINELQALVIVEHEGGFYNLYMSDETGVHFSLSLRDLVFDTSQFDFELIHGVNATMIANQYAREDVTQSDSLKRTLITFDNGARWEPVLPPNEDVDGASINCELPDCSLHFHMDTSNYTRLGVYSTDSAPGIVVAHGNTGAGVSSSPNLYLSRDGGVSWEETLSGSWRVSVADHGGLMVAVRDYHQDMSTELMYTCDEGYNWQTFTFIATPITVYDMITEPGEHTTIVSLYGGERGSDSFMWVVVTVEFAPIFQRACTDNDFYDWMLWEVSERDCILGSRVTIERREPQVCCQNGRDYVREVNFTICQCNREDFECDYGYARVSTDSPGSCIRDEDVSLPDPCADGKTETYNASTGYRKIAGDVCQGGVEFLYSPFIASCDENSTLPPTLQDPTDTTHTPTITSSTSSTSVPIPSVEGTRKDTPKDILMPVLVAVGVVFGLVFIAVLTLCIVIGIRRSRLRRSYTSIASTGETEQQRYTVTPTEDIEMEKSVEDVTPDTD